MSEAHDVDERKMTFSVDTYSRIPSPGASASRAICLPFSSRAGTMSKTLRIELKVKKSDSFAKSRPGQMLGR